MFDIHCETVRVCLSPGRSPNLKATDHCPTAEREVQVESRLMIPSIHRIFKIILHREIPGSNARAVDCTIDRSALWFIVSAFITKETGKQFGR